MCKYDFKLGCGLAFYFRLIMRSLPCSLARRVFSCPRTALMPERSQKRLACMRLLILENFNHAATRLEQFKTSWPNGVKRGRTHQRSIAVLELLLIFQVVYCRPNVYVDDKSWFSEGFSAQP